jgi:nitronate monooxygenase
MNNTITTIKHVNAFCERYGLRIPILMAPMAGACPVALATAISNAGGMGACGALLMNAAAINSWVSQVRSSTNGAFQLNTWIPDPEPTRNPEHEKAVREFLSNWGPEVSADAAEAPQVDFVEQCDAMIAACPRVISSIMGLYPADVVARMKAEGIHWFANATTVKEALAAESAGADVIIAQGMEAGGHRGAFNADEASSTLVGLFALLPAIVDAVRIPVIATGGIADARHVAAAIVLGASAVQIGTGLLRSPEANINKAWSDAIAQAQPEDTIATRAFSGRLGRSIRTAFAEAAARSDTPEPAPYPLQRNLTRFMRDQANKASDIDRMQAWAGQSSAYAREVAAGTIIRDLWDEAQTLLPRH